MKLGWNKCKSQFLSMNLGWNQGQSEIREKFGLNKDEVGVKLGLKFIFEGEIWVKLEWVRN